MRFNNIDIDGLTRLLKNSLLNDIGLNMWQDNVVESTKQLMDQKDRITLRDYLAANAAEEDINRHIHQGYRDEYIQDNGDGTRQIRSRQAMWTREQARYLYADAMIRARKEIDISK